MAKKKLNQNIPIELLNVSAGTQQRPLSPETVKHYMDLRKDGVELPPIEVVNDGKEHYVWDGFHRVAVAKNRGDTHVRANVEIGNLRHALWMSYHANSTHGLPRPSGSTQFIVEQILADSEWSEKSVAVIALHVGCSRQYVHQCKRAPSTVDKSQDISPQAPSPGAKKTETEPNAPIKDSQNAVIPLALVDRFLSRSILRKQIEEMDKWKNVVMNSIAGSEMTFALLNQTGFLADFKNLRARVKSAIPYALCPYCKAKGCGACHNSSFLNEESWKAAPKND